MTVALQRLAEAASRHGRSELKRVDYLDGCRGLAIAFVLQEHFLTIAGFESGRLGVDVFFCLSGFLMSRILFVNRVPLATFYKRRISRILPVFLLFVVLVYGAAWLAGQPRGWVDFLATVTFLRTYLPAQPDLWHTGLPLGHLWSLNVEEHCYVLLSLITLLALTRARTAGLLGALALGSIATLLWYDRHSALAPALFEIRTEAAASHLLLSAGYFLVRERFERLVQPWMPVLALMVSVLAYTAAAPWWAAQIVTPFLLAFAVNHLSRVWGWLRAALAAAPLRLLGLWSYSIYLWQQPFYQFKGSFPPGLALICVLAVGAASFYLFENPIRSWLNRRW